MVEYTRKQLEAKDKDELIDIILIMQSMINSLVARVDTLEKEVAILKKPTNSRNSSRPPSTDLFQHKNQSLRQKSNRKTGGQSGHLGHTLEMRETRILQSIICLKEIAHAAIGLLPPLILDYGNNVKLLIYLK